MRRIPELDALRGLAAVAIVVYHLWLIRYGFLGTAVDLFFVMSGYLITTIILGQQGRPGFLATFYARRSLRIWPIYYLSLAAFVAMNLGSPNPAELDALPYFLTYTQNLQHYWFAEAPTFGHGFSHTWSLAVEEQYYMIWPLILVLLRPRSLYPAAAALVALAIGSRMGGFTKWILLTRCDGLALGGVLAGLMAARESGRLTGPAALRILVVAGIGSVAFLYRGDASIRLLASTWPAAADPLVALSLRMFAINLMYFSLIGLVVVRSGSRWLAPLRDRRLIGLGQMSYGIYLYHGIVFVAVDDWAARLGLSGRWAIDGVKVSASFALAAASWRLVERPMLSLKDRFGYRSGPIPAPLVRADRPILDNLRSGTA